MNIRRVKQGAKITLFNGVYAIILGFFYIIFSKWILKSSFQAIDIIWQLFEKYNPKIATLLNLINYTLGVQLISMGVFIIYLSYFIMKRKEKITWVILFISGLIFWAGVFTINIFIGNMNLIALIGFGWLVFIIGMLIPIRYYLEKPYREY